MNDINFNEFKNQASSFFKYAKTSTKEQIDNGFKQLGIAYLNLDGTDLELHQADLLIQMAGRVKDEQD